MLVKGDRNPRIVIITLNLLEIAAIFDGYEEIDENFAIIGRYTKDWMY